MIYLFLFIFYYSTVHDTAQFQKYKIYLEIIQYLNWNSEEYNNLRKFLFEKYLKLSVPINILINSC